MSVRAKLVLTMVTATMWSILIAVTAAGVVAATIQFSLMPGWVWVPVMLVLPILTLRTDPKEKPVLAGIFCAVEAGILYTVWIVYPDALPLDFKIIPEWVVEFWVVLGLGLGITLAMTPELEKVLRKQSQ